MSKFAIFGSVVEYGERYRDIIEEFDTEEEAEANISRIEWENQNNTSYEFIFVDEI